MPFITVDATNKHENGTRPTKINTDSIAYVTSCGELHDAGNHAVIVFAGGLSSANERLVVKQTAAEVSAAIDAALS